MQLSGLGTTLSGINFIVTIMKMRAPGMALMKMPVFTWTALVTNILIVAAFPVLAATLALLTLDRYLDMHFFTNDLGGNVMMYVNLIWIWGHPEVYILVLPCFGVFSEIVATYSKKTLFGYKSMVYATASIGVLSFLVWLHHFFTMGAGANVNAFFGIMTMIISIPTGAKVFNWLFTMYRGRVEFSLPMLWTIGFMIIFVIGGMTGVLMAIPAVSFVLHNSLFLVAHFHNTIIGGVVFGCIAGMVYWFPKAFGFKLNERLGRYSFWCWFVGFFLTFTPMYLLGFKGMTRRLNTYDNPEWQPYLLVALVGATLIMLGIFFLLQQVFVSIRDRKGKHGRHGRPVGRPHAGVVHFLAAAVLQLRPRAAHRLARPVLGRQGKRPRLPAPGQVRRRAHAAQHRRGHLHRRLRPGDVLRPDLAHVVAGHRRLPGHDRVLRGAFV